MTTASTTHYALAGTALALLTAFLLFQPNNLVKWLQKKNYQYEVTFALYMLTPTEKFIFNSVLFLTFSMLTICCVLYLPNHVATISRRAYYYFAGDAAVLEVSRQAVGLASKTTQATMSTTTGFAAEMYDAITQTMAATAHEAASRGVEDIGLK